MEISHIDLKLKALMLGLSEDLLVHLLLISLPNQFSQFKVSYNYQSAGLNRSSRLVTCTNRRLQNLRGMFSFILQYKLGLVQRPGDAYRNYDDVRL